MPNQISNLRLLSMAHAVAAGSCWRRRSWPRGGLLAVLQLAAQEKVLPLWQPVAQEDDQIHEQQWMGLNSSSGGGRVPGAATGGTANGSKTLDWGEGLNSVLVGAVRGCGWCRLAGPVYARLGLC
jgi:hypothetical protein